MGVENAMKLEFCFGRNPRLLFYNLGQAEQLIVQIKESIEALNKSLDDNKEVYSNGPKEYSKDVESYPTYFILEKVVLQETVIRHLLFIIFRGLWVLYRERKGKVLFT